MFSTFLLAVQQLAVLWIFMALGFVLRRKGILPESAGEALSRLEIFVFLPALNIKTFSAYFRPEILKPSLLLLGVALAVLAASFALAVPAGRFLGRSRSEQDIFTYSLTIPNFGYLGYPLVGAVFGEGALAAMMIYTIPYNLFVYTAGFYILHPNKEFSLRRALNPVVLSTLAGILLGLTGLALPSPVTEAAKAGAACMAPAAMLLTGFVLAKQPLRSLLRGARIYLVCALRLLALPAALGSILFVFGARGDLFVSAAATLAMPCGLNSVVFPEALGGDSKAGAQLALVSNVLGLLTIPALFAILESMH